MTDGWAGRVPEFDSGDSSDDEGNPLGSTDNDGGSAQPFGPAVRRQLMSGVANGDFYLTPLSPDGEISTDNPLPYWTITKATGTEIQAYSVVDASSGSGRVLRFDLGGSAASDETYVEQRVPVNGARGRAFAYAVKATVLSAAFSGGNAAVKVKAQYLKADGTVTGSETVTTVNFTLIVSTAQDISTTALVVPADAYWLRVRVGILQTNATSASLDVTEVRVLTCTDDLYLVDQATPANTPARIKKSSGDLSIDAGSGTITFAATAITRGNGNTRSLFLMPEDATLDSATFATLGASPNLTRAVAYADAATQGAHWSFLVPLDWSANAINAQPVWSPGSTDGVAHTVRWSYIAKEIIAGTTVTAAGTTTTWTGASAARTVSVAVVDTATTLGVTPSAAGSMQTLTIRRIGADAADTYVGVVNLIGVILTYTATL